MLLAGATPNPVGALPNGFTDTFVANVESASTGPFRLGGNGVWGEWFAGLIDEVRVYDRALSASEIQQDSQTPVG